MGSALPFWPVQNGASKAAPSPAGAWGPSGATAGTVPAYTQDAPAPRTSPVSTRPHESSACRAS